MTKLNQHLLCKYAQIAHEHYCFGNNIPPYWEGLDSEKQEFWINLVQDVINEFKSDHL